MKIVKTTELEHRQLMSVTSGELFSLSSVVSGLLGTDQLFIHHDILPPGCRSSNSHRHSVVDEVVYIKKGAASVVIGNKSHSANEGSFVCFSSADKHPHHVMNQTNDEIETITFAVNSALDQVIYINQTNQHFTLPEFSFDEDLREVPISKDDWLGFVDHLKIRVETETHENNRLMFYELLGVANRVLLNFDAAEYYLKRALTVSYKHPNQSKLIENLIRLAHVYQWKKRFEMASFLIEQAWLILIDLPEAHSLQASYHQHLGKFYCDQGLLSSAQAEFETAISIRQSINAPSDQIESSMTSLRRVLTLRGKTEGLVQVRRALIKDAEDIHNAHMKSIQHVCSKDHSKDEVDAWGHRPFKKDQREFSIKNDLVLVATKNGQVEGYGHVRLFEKDSLKHAHISGLYLTPVVLGMSVGHSIMEVILEQCRYQKVNKITLQSTITAKSFYKKIGFEQDGGEMAVEINGQPIRCYPMKMEL